MLSAQNSPVQSVPQADGNSKPLGDYLRGQQFRSLPDGPVRVHVQTRGPAFDGLHNRPLATELARSLQAEGLSACGDVLSALDRKCVSDLVDAWARLVTVLRLDFVPMNLTIGFWGTDPYARLSASVVQAMCHADVATATVKWVSADAAIRAFVRGHRDQMAKELHGETHLSDYAISEHGPTDQARVSHLQEQMDRLTAFVAGVR